MLTKSLTLFTLAAGALAAPQTLGDIAASLTSQFGALATEISALTADGAIASQLNAATSLVNVLSGIPTLPTSVLAVLQTAVPVADLTRADLACSATAASWYNNLPGDVKGALTSYQSALATWVAGHSSVLAQYTGDLSVPVCTATAGGIVTTGSSRTQLSTARSTGAAGSATSAAGNAATTTNSRAGAAHATAIAGSVAGVVGAIGVMLAL